MKKNLSVFMAVAAFALLTAMGGTPDSEVPVPKVDFRVTITDDQDVITKCANVSWEGETFFKAERGKGVVTVPFEKIKKIVKIGSAVNRKTDFQLLLKTGEVVAVTTDDDMRFFGVTSFGTYRIFAKNIKEISFE
ncbi:MAG: hypothetical protein WA162_05450 [Thermodesulfobacteriota bacterium]